MEAHKVSVNGIVMQFASVHRWWRRMRQNARNQRGDQQGCWKCSDQRPPESMSRSSENELSFATMNNTLVIIVLMWSSGDYRGYLKRDLYQPTCALHREEWFDYLFKESNHCFRTLAGYSFISMETLEEPSPHGWAALENMRISGVRKAEVGPYLLGRSTRCVLSVVAIWKVLSSLFMHSFNALLAWERILKNSKFIKSKQTISWRKGEQRSHHRLVMLWEDPSWNVSEGSCCIFE